MFVGVFGRGYVQYAIAPGLKSVPTFRSPSVKEWKTIDSSIITQYSNIFREIDYCETNLMR